MTREDEALFQQAADYVGIRPADRAPGRPAPDMDMWVEFTEHDPEEDERLLHEATIKRLEAQVVEGEIAGRFVARRKAENDALYAQACVALGIEDDAA